MKRTKLAVCLWAAAAALAQEARDRDAAQNLALGKKVIFLPAPNYANTQKGDDTDLTDGEISKRTDQRIWLDAASVGWSYAGRVNLAVDLGSVQPVDEVAIRWLGGSQSAGTSIPLWVEVMVSDAEAGPWYKVAEFSRWNAGDMARYGVPRSAGTSWVHRLRFQNLKTRARMVGIRFYSTAYTAADELYVFRGAHDPGAVRFDASARSDFTVTGAEMHFHTPVVPVAANIVAPLAAGMVSSTLSTPRPMTVAITLPAGVRLAGGNLSTASASAAEVAEGESTVRYTFSFRTAGINNKVFGRLYLTGSPRAGAPSELTYQLRWGDYESPLQRVPMKFIEIPAIGALPRRLTTGLSWWSVSDTRAWPEWQTAFRTLGLNTLTAFTDALNPSDTATLEFVAAAREAGYRIQSIDSTWHRLLSRRAREAEIYCQFADGTHGTRLCPSYRGQYYQEELDRVAAAARLLGTRLLHCDVELWSVQSDFQKCTRCQRDRELSGLPLGEWQLAKGAEMWTDLYQAVARATGGTVEMGLYDGRPGENYQRIWPFDRLYPKYMQTSQVSTYTSLEPYHIAFTGDEVRQDRSRLPKSDVFPWISPGDAGTFPGDEFYYVLLECFFNGSRGVNFWSGRVWNAETLAAYARAIRVVAPVEDVIVDGELFLPAVEGQGRVSGMRRGGRMLLLVADYFGDAGGTVKVKLNLAEASRVSDLETGRTVADLKAGAGVLEVKVPGGTARPLDIRPLEPR